jgi:hypothetical protein
MWPLTDLSGGGRGRGGVMTGQVILLLYLPLRISLLQRQRLTPQSLSTLWAMQEKTQRGPA